MNSEGLYVHYTNQESGVETLGDLGELYVHIPTIHLPPHNTTHPGPGGVYVIPSAEPDRNPNALAIARRENDKGDNGDLTEVIADKADHIQDGSKGWELCKVQFASTYHVSNDGTKFASTYHTSDDGKRAQQTRGRLDQWAYSNNDRDRVLVEQLKLERRQFTKDDLETCLSVKVDRAVITKVREERRPTTQDAIAATDDSVPDIHWYLVGFCLGCAFIASLPLAIAPLTAFFCAESQHRQGHIKRFYLLLTITWFLILACLSLPVVLCVVFI